MKVVLINPPPKKVVEERFDRPEYGHIGLAYLASYLGANGIDCEVIDAKLEGKGLREVVKKVEEYSPQVVGLTAMTHEISQAAKTARAIKNFFPKIKVVVGGIHATVLPERTLEEFPFFDVVCIGEGERTLHELCLTLEKGGELSLIKGIAYRDQGGVKVNERRDFIVGVDELPFPAWDKFSETPIYHIQTARGCPFNCVFCTNPNGRKVRARSVENVFAEIKYVVEKFKPKELYFIDETFTLDKERVGKILDLMVKEGLNKKIKWMTQTHVNTVDEEILRKMKDAGCYHLGFGIESGNEEILKKVGKGITKEGARTAVEAARKVGLPVAGYFILGQPDETLETVKDTISFAIELNPDLPVFGIMVPYPGTKVAEMAKEGYGGYRIKSIHWEDYNKQLGDALEFDHLSRRRLEMLQLFGYLKVFLYNHRFIDLAKFAWTYKKMAWEASKKLWGSFSFFGLSKARELNG